jgi:hypothetical protein
MCALWNSNKSDDAKRRAKIVEMLGDIRDQRAKMKLVFGEDVTSIRDVSASLLEFDANSLTVEVTSLKGTSPTWIGSSVACFFRVKDREFKNQEHFMTFDTKIVSAEQRPSGFVHIGLALPDRVHNAQQRRGVRVKADITKVPTFLLWKTPDIDKDLTTVPPVFGAPEYTGKLLKVDNFSAGGVRLLVSRTLLREVLPDANKGEHFSLYFHAVDEPGAKPVAFWVEAVLRNIFHDPETSETALGLEFVAEGTLDVNKRLIWRPLRFDEVTGLGKFVFKWNLDLYREKGLGG